MPFDTASIASTASTAASALLNGVDLAPVIDSLEPRRAHAARMGLALGWLH